MTHIRSTYLPRAAVLCACLSIFIAGHTTLPTPVAAQPPAASAALVREPYLQQVSDRSAIVVWASREPGPARAVVGGRTFAAQSVFYPASTTRLSYSYYQHEALVTGLSAQTSYRYDAYVGAARVTPGTDKFRTAPTPGTGIASFVLVGDSGTGSVEQKALASLMKRETFDLMLHAGDIVYGNTGGTGDASHLTYQNWFFNIYRDILRQKPFVPTMGNHDARASNGWGKAYLNVYVLPDEAGTGPHPDHAERYYSFDYGPAHFVVLDTEMGFLAGTRRTAQLAWLKADLSSTTQPWKVVLFHRAPYSSGIEHGSSVDVRAAFGPLFERYGVQFVLAGHDHDYERLVPWRESTDLSRQAVVYFVSGGGGAPLYAVGRNQWTATARSAHQFLKGYISGCVAYFKAVDTTGAEIDRYSLDRCAQAADTAAPTVSVLQPTDRAAVTGTVTIKGEAHDDTRVEKVDLWVDGVLRAIDVTAPYSFSWNTGREAAGTHGVELRAYDIDGRRATKRITVTVS
jgi:acid phosphatase type 7